jgi:hypothetical protein
LNNITQNQNKKLSLKEYQDSILNISNEIFAPMYRYVFQQYWHNSLQANMTRSYHATDWKDGKFEIYIPTSPNPEASMNYYRIIIKVCPELNNKLAREESRKQVLNPLILPVGKIDSELVILITPRLNEQGFVRGFRHEKNKKGYMTAVFVDKHKQPIPLMHKILEKIIEPFLEKRLLGIFESLDLQPYKYDYSKLSKLYYIWNNLIASFSYSLGQIVKSFSHCLNWFAMKRRHLKTLLGDQSIEKAMLERIEPLSLERQIRLYRKISEQLKQAEQEYLKTHRDKKIDVPIDPAERYLEVLASRRH